MDPILFFGGIRKGVLWYNLFIFLLFEWMENLKSHINNAILTSCEISDGEKIKLIKKYEQLKEERKKVG